MTLPDDDKESLNYQTSGTNWLKYTTFFSHFETAISFIELKDHISELVCI